MTRKDYVNLADALRDALPAECTIEQYAQWRRDCDAVARACSEDSSRFDRERFDRHIGIN